MVCLPTHSIQPEYSRVAQLVEQVAVNHRVAGSSPAAGADTNPAWRCPTTLCRVWSLGGSRFQRGKFAAWGSTLYPQAVERPSHLCGPCRRSSMVTSGRWLRPGLRLGRGPSSSPFTWMRDRHRLAAISVGRRRPNEPITCPPKGPSGFPPAGWRTSSTTGIPRTVHDARRIARTVPGAAPSFRFSSRGLRSESARSFFLRRVDGLKERRVARRFPSVYSIW